MVVCVCVCVGSCDDRSFSLSLSASNAVHNFPTFERRRRIYDVDEPCSKNSQDKINDIKTKQDTNRSSQRHYDSIRSTFTNHSVVNLTLLCGVSSSSFTDTNVFSKNAWYCVRSGLLVVHGSKTKRPLESIMLGKSKFGEKTERMSHVL